MLTKIYIHYITTLFVLYLFHLKGKKIGIGIGIGQFARKKSVSESAKKNHDRCITNSYQHLDYLICGFMLRPISTAVESCIKTHLWPLAVSSRHLLH